MAAHVRDPLVKLFSKTAYFLSILGKLLLAPAVGYGLEDGDQGRRRGEDNSLLDPLLDQRRTLLQTGAKERFPWRVQDHKLSRGLYMGPISSAAQRPHL